MASAVSIDTAGLGQAISSIGDLATKLRSAITGKVDPALALQVEQHLADLEAQANAAQSAIDAAEAASPRFFVAGWRPAVGWICVLSVFVNFIVVWAMQIAFPSVKVPTIPSDQLWPLMLGMLGIGTLRTVDKIKGVAAQ
jgi:hypothetical protein